MPTAHRNTPSESTTTELVGPATDLSALLTDNEFATFTHRAEMLSNERTLNEIAALDISA